jgi:replicative DNA helicase
MRDDTPTPNRDLAAEAGVLGALMANRNNVPVILATLTGPDFYDPQHEAVFDAIHDLYESGEPTDAISVARRLMKSGDLNRVGGHPYLHELLHNAPVSGIAYKYAGTVAGCAKMRRGASTATSLYQAFTDPKTDPDDVPEILLTAIRHLEDDLAEIGTDDNPRPADLIDDVYEGIEHPKAKAPSIATGLHDLDDFYPGHSPGNLVLIGARPAVGKSTLGLTFARNAANNGIPTLFVSLEMSTTEVMHRLLAAEAGIPLDHIQKSACNDWDWDRIAAADARIRAMPFYIDDSPSQGLAQVRTTVAKMRRGAGVGLVLIDYLQLMPTGKAESRQQEVSNLSRGLKLLAKEFAIPVIALSQLNRDVEKRQDKMPIKSDLRESGSLEQDADSIILMYREDMDGSERRVGEVDLIVAKSRHGREGIATVAFQGHNARCMSFARDWTSPGAMRDAA